LRLWAAPALLALAACAGPRADTSARKTDRVFLHEGLRESEVIAAWGKPDGVERGVDNGRPAALWVYDRLYKQKPGVAYWPRSLFTLTFIDGKLRRWSEKQR